MDQAKAIINLKEGIVQLEGPVEFVREYLSVYGSAIKGLQGIPKEMEATPKQKAVRSRAKVSRARIGARRTSCVNTVRAEVEAGFFNEPRSVQEVRQLLTEKEKVYSNSSVSTCLKKLVESGLLSRRGAGRAVRYQRSG